MYSAAPGTEECATLDENAEAPRRETHGGRPHRATKWREPRVQRSRVAHRHRMSKVFEGKIEVLDIKGDTVTILRENKRDGG